MRHQQTLKNRVVSLMKRKSVLRPRDLDTHGIPRMVLQRLYNEGVLERVGHGLYRLASALATEHRTVAEVCKRVPHGVVCLLSALRFHDLTTQAPFEVWLAIDVKARKPRINLPVRFVRFSGPALTEGVEVRRVDGVPVRVYNPAKTVADCFKYRNKIGLDVALEALRECRKTQRSSMDDLWHYAKICRVSNVMRPYLEAMST
jgi:predicted transcriptional regulator of viral defense system